MPHSTPLAAAARVSQLVRRVPAAVARGGRRRWIAAGATAVLATPFVVRATVGAPDAGATAAAALDAPRADVETPVARLVAVADAAAPRTVANASGRHLGFDTSNYPGDAALRRWKETAPYEWVGFYLPAPCHRDASWSGKRETIAGMGFGMAVVYVGQQTWGRTPQPGSAAARRALAAGRRCDANFVAAPRGADEGRDAVARTAAEGFARGTIVFLDIERMERMPAAMRDYYRAWTREVLADGRFIPGVYVHAHNAPTVHDDLVAEFAAAGRAIEPPVWVASGKGFSRESAPHEVGHWFADVWQGVLDKVESHGGVRIPIDVNVAAVPSPSAVYALTE